MFSHRIESSAIVLHRKLNAAADYAKLDLNRDGAGMAGDITKRLLRDPVKTKGHGLGRLVDVASRSEARWNSLYAVEARALGLERLDQSEVFENRRMQRVGQGMHVLAELDQVVAY